MSQVNVPGVDDLPEIIEFGFRVATSQIFNSDDDANATKKSTKHLIQVTINIDY